MYKKQYQDIKQYHLWNLKWEHFTPLISHENLLKLTSKAEPHVLDSHRGPMNITSACFLLLFLQCNYNWKPPNLVIVNQLLENANGWPRIKWEGPSHPLWTSWWSLGTKWPSCSNSQRWAKEENSCLFRKGFSVDIKDRREEICIILFPFPGIYWHLSKVFHWKLTSSCIQIGLISELNWVSPFLCKRY